MSLRNLATVSAAMLASAVASSPALCGGVAPTADEILKQVSRKIDAASESATVVMTIIEANGSSKTREIEIHRKSDHGQKVLVRLQAPDDLRGTALLSVETQERAGQQGHEDQWLYLPSSHQARRILGATQGGSFLDSELSYEDMGAASDRKYTHAILRMEGDVAVIESRLRGGNSAYGRILTWVPLKTDLVSRIEYYDRSGRLLKTSEMKSYQQFGRIWRAREIDVRNAQNHRGTRLVLKNLQVNRGMDEDEFTVASLSGE